MPSPLIPQPSPRSIETPTYRAYRLDREGHIDSAEIIEASSDDEARTKAAAMVNGHGIELWERTRLLGSYKSANDDR